MFQNIKEGSLKFPLYLSEEAKDLIKKLMHRTPRARLGMRKKGVEEIKSHPWFKSINWKVAMDRGLPVEKPEIKPIIDDKISTEVLGKNGDDTKYIEGWDFQNKMD